MMVVSLLLNKLRGENETSKSWNSILDHAHKCVELFDWVGHAGARAQTKPVEFSLDEYRGALANPGAA